MPEAASELLLVLTTVGTHADAERLARAMIESRHAACAQISAIDSVYRWQGAVLHEAEWRVLFKTTAAAYPALEAALRAQHPYELPAILAWPCSAALPEFAAWVAGEVAAG